MSPLKSLDYSHALYKTKDKNKKAFLEIAKSLGLDTKKLLKISKSAKVENILEQNRVDAKQNNIKGVPGYLINNKRVIVGARELSFFENVLEGKPNDNDGGPGNGEGC